MSDRPGMARIVPRASANGVVRREVVVNRVSVANPTGPSFGPDPIGYLRPEQSEGGKLAETSSGMHSIPVQSRTPKTARGSEEGKAKANYRVKATSFADGVEIDCWIPASPSQNGKQVKEPQKHPRLPKDQTPAVA